MKKILPITALDWTMVFLKTAFAAGVGDTVERPLSDWLKNNPYGVVWLAGKYVVSMGRNALMDPSTYPLLEGVFPGPDGEEAGTWDSILAMKEGETVTTGTVLEKTMPDGTTEITVDINVQNGPLTIYRGDEFSAYRIARINDPDNEELLNNPPDPVLGDRENGSIDYKLLVKITHPAPGMDIELINAYAIGLVPDAGVKAWAFSGTGSGTFTDHAADFIDWHFTPGTTGTVHLPGTLAVGKPGKAEGNVFELRNVEFSPGKEN